MKRNELTIVIDFKIYLYLFEPIIKHLEKHNVFIYICLPDALLTEAKEILKASTNIEFISLTSIKKKHKIRFMIHRTFATLFTRGDFSFQYKKKLEQTTKKYSGFQGFLLKIAKFTPKVANKNINGFLHSVSGFCFLNPFPTRVILAGSLNASPELLTAKNQKVVTVMESWDHPVKHPNGYKSHSIYTWNQSLSIDWAKNQYENRCYDFFPLKLRFPLENKLESNNDKPCGNKVLMYAISSTSRFSVSVMTSLDLRIIEKLIVATKRAGWTLRLKPRPNGTNGEFDHYKQYEHVEVMDINEHVNVPADYYLDDAYNKKRFDALNDVSAVVNSFSTFGLDAACYGVPVIQLDLRKNADFEDSYMIFDNYHLKTHVLGRKNTFNVEHETLEDAVVGALSGNLDFAKEYSNEIYHWLTQGRDMDSALSMLYKNLFEEEANV